MILKRIKILLIKKNINMIFINIFILYIKKKIKYGSNKFKKSNRFIWFLYNI